MLSAKRKSPPVAPPMLLRGGTLTSIWLPLALPVWEVEPLPAQSQGRPKERSGGGARRRREQQDSVAAADKDELSSDTRGRQQQDRKEAEEQQEQQPDQPVQQQPGRARKRRERRKRRGAGQAEQGEGEGEGVEGGEAMSEGEETAAAESVPVPAPEMAAAASGAPDLVNAEAIESEAEEEEITAEDEEALEATVAEGAVGGALLCPISLALPIDPVVASDGMIYERRSLEGWIARCRDRECLELCGALMSALTSSTPWPIPYQPHTHHNKTGGLPLTSPKTGLPMEPHFIPCHNFRAIINGLLEEKRAELRRCLREERERWRRERDEEQEQQRAAAAEAARRASWWGWSLAWVGGQTKAKAE